VTAPYALVLAAGLGSRFGGRKLLSPWRGGVLLDGALGAALGAPVEAVTVIVGAQAADVATAARAFADARGQTNRLQVVDARDYAQGLSASLIAGLAAVPAEAPGVLVFLGDMPLVAAATAARLAEALTAGAVAAAPVFQGVRGNPVALSRALFGPLMNLTGDRGARGLLDQLGEQVVLIEAEDDGVLLDVDRPEDKPP
jgi:molybdenum cofactor cytidylyltransferase